MAISWTGTPLKDFLVFGTQCYAFHGTGKENVKSICQNNLNVISRCVYGYGYYLSEYPDISQSYGAGLLMFKVLPGNEYLGTDHYSHYGPNAQYQSKKLTSYKPYGIKQMDLLYTGGKILEQTKSYGFELIIADNEQFVPYCIIHLKMK